MCTIIYIGAYAPGYNQRIAATFMDLKGIFYLSWKISCNVS